MNRSSIIILIFMFCTCFQTTGGAIMKEAIIIEAEAPTIQFGSRGLGPEFSAASGGRLLCSGWGSSYGHFAEYQFEVEENIVPARITIRYARALSDIGHLQITLDGKTLSTTAYVHTGGWGDKQSDYQTIEIDVEKIETGSHTLQLTVVNKAYLLRSGDLELIRPIQSTILDLIGNRSDKNTVGHGNNVALYTGLPSKYFFATHELGDIFSATDGTTINWYPDHILLNPSAQAAPNVNLDKIMITQAISEPQTSGYDSSKTKKLIEWRQVCITKNDVVVSQIWLINTTGQSLMHTFEVTGDCRKSFDWREQPGGKKSTRKEGKAVLLVDYGVFPAILKNGLCMAIGGDIDPVEVDTKIPGTYRMVYNIHIPANTTKLIKLACAINADEDQARRYLEEVLEKNDPIIENRQDWQNFYESEIPNFSCSDRSLMELYGLRWFLLKFSTAGGNLGYFKYPVVMEGREAYQTYCCYSAPFMAYDMNWLVDPKKGFGHIANMTEIIYEDGRFPFYTSPRTNKVFLHHESRTGQSALQHALWKHYLIHGNKQMLHDVYPAMKKNMQWWIKDRDADSNGLFIIKDQLECMDDLYRWGYENRKKPYESMSVNSTTYINLRHIAKIARILGYNDDADYFSSYADKTENAVNTKLWDDKRKAWFDRLHGIEQLATHYPVITMFYPFYAGIGGPAQLDVFRKHLLNPEEFWLPYPVPALPRNHPDFGPEKYWEGPSWPASTSHVIEGFSNAAKQYDRSLLPKAAELFNKAISLHLQPQRADFYERYNPLNGHGLSVFRDYMHSWWIDLIIRHVVGFMLNDDGSISIDPLPTGLDNFALCGVPFHDQRIDVLWYNPDKLETKIDFDPGLTVKLNGKIILYDAKFRLGDEPKHIEVKI